MFRQKPTIVGHLADGFRWILMDLNGIRWISAASDHGPALFFISFRQSPFGYALRHNAFAAGYPARPARIGPLHMSTSSTAEIRISVNLNEETHQSMECAPRFNLERKRASRFKLDRTERTLASMSTSSTACIGHHGFTCWETYICTQRSASQSN